MRIEKTMWRMLRSIVSSRNRIKRREMVRSTVDEVYVGKVYATVKSISSKPTLRNYGVTEATVVGRAPSTITSVLSESVRKTTTAKEEAQIKRSINTVKDVSSERVLFTAGVNLENTVVAKTVLNILYISSEEV